MGRQGHQRGTFLLEGLRRNQPGFRHRAMFHADRGPLEGLLIQIFQAGKVAPREEVRFYGPEAAFLAGFAISGTITAFRPVPLRRARFVLSITQIRPA